MPERARSLSEDLVEGLSDAIILLDGEFRFRYVNAATEQLYGKMRGELVGTCLWDLFPDARGTHAYEECQRALRNRAATHYETYWQPWRRWFEATVVPSGPGLAIQFRDITPRKRVDTLLTGEKRALDLAMRGEPLATILEELALTFERYSDDGTIASILRVVDGRLRHGAAPGLPDAYNAAIDGLTIGPDVGSCGTAAFTDQLVVASDIMSDARWAAFRALASEHGLRACWSTPFHASDGRVAGTFALYRRAPDHEPTPEQIEAVKMLSNTAAMVIERHNEAEARRAAALELAAAKTAAERANNTKDEFLAVLGHELRNPLAPIVTALHLMEARGDEGSRPARAVIARQVEHLVRLVDDLLDVSRIASGRITLERRVIDVADIVARAVEMTAPLFERRRNQLSVRVQPGLFVHGDMTRLAQVLANLLTNAAKYSDAGARTTLIAATSGDRIRIEVRDTGIGIARESLAHVFELFMQTEEAVGRAQGGLGLGLAIVHNLVQMHGGTVSADSEGLGKGSAFTVELPALAPPARGVEAGATTALAPARVPRRVLVVDDNQDVAAMMAEMLSEVGHEVRTAADGPGALAAATDFAPDAVLLDIGLPVLDGYQVARQLRATRDRSFLIAITGYGQQADRDRARAAGFDAHLIKPVGRDALLGLLEHLAAGA